jgi:hypothetical protein
MPRPVMCLALLLVGLGTVANGDEATKDDSMKAWSSFVGKWKVTNPNGDTNTTQVARSQSNSCFIHQGENATHVVGWDSADQSLKSTTFGADGGHSIGQWKLVGDGPKFSGEMKGVGPDGAEGPPTSVTITFESNDRWEIVAGEMKITAQRIE